MKRMILGWLFSLLSLPALATCPTTACYTLGTYGATDATGWTTFTQSPASTSDCNLGGSSTNTGTCIWYIAASGSDSNDCSTVSTPCATLGHVIASILIPRWATVSRPDWVLLRKGDTFTNQCITDDGLCTGSTFHLWGHSQEEPLVFGAYDPAVPGVVNPQTGGARPILATPSSATAFMPCRQQPTPSLFTGCNRIALVGINFYPYQSDASVTGRATVEAQMGFHTANPTTFLLVEDCKFSWFGAVGLSIDGPNSPLLANPYGGYYIRRNVFVDVYGQGLEGQSAQSGNGFVVEENIGDHNGNPQVTGTATITPGNPTLVTWANGFPTGDRSIASGNQGFLTFSPGCSGITAGTPYYQYNNNFSTFNLSSSSSSNVAVNSTGCSPTSQTITWQVVGGSALTFNHNFYLGNHEYASYITDPNWQLGQTTVRGNMLSGAGHDIAQWRMGGIWSDNLATLSSEGQYWGNPTPGNNSTVSNNVYIGLSDNGPRNFVRNSYHASRYSIGTTTLTGNLFLNGTNPTAMGGPISVLNGDTISYSNNIAYNWPGPSALVDLQGGDGGINTIKNLSGGTGYTNSTSVTINSFTTGANGFVALNVSASPPPITFAFVWISGNTGAGCVLNNQLFGTIVQEGSKVVELQGITANTNCNNDGNVYSALLDVGGCIATFPLTYSSGSGGSSATAHFIVAGGIVRYVGIDDIDSLNLCGGQGSSAQPGHGYAANDHLTASLPGGSGLAFDVDTVSVVTNGGGNKFCPNGASSSGCGAGTFPDPSKTLADYMNLITGTGGHTTQDYVTAARGQSKANWNPLLMPGTGPNQYFRANFGIGHAFGTTNP